MHALRHRWREAYAVLQTSLLGWLLLQSNPTESADIRPPGHRPLPPSVHALIGGNVVIKPGQILNPGTVLIRDGLIEAAGESAQIAVPPEARVWDLKGHTVYAGFIDPYLVLESTNNPVNTASTQPITADDLELTSGGIRFFGVPGGERDPGRRGPGSELAPIVPQHRAVEAYSPSIKTLESYRELGFTTANIVPGQGILRGQSTVVALSDTDPNEAVIRADVWQCIALDPEASPGRAYPQSLMGVIAAVRQSFFDADFYRRDRNHYETHPQSRTRPPFNPATEALLPALDRKMRVVIEPGSVLMVDRASRLAAELGLDYCLVSSGEEWRRPDLARATKTTFIVPLNFPEVSKLPEDDDWDQVSLDQLRAWDWAPENPAVLRQQELPIALTTYALGEKKNFRKNLRLALDRGLTETDALAGLTTEPARLLGLDDRLGTIEPGRIANLTVVEGSSYFEPTNKVREVWIDGRRYAVRPGDKPKTEPKDEATTQLAGGDKTESAEKTVKNPKGPETAALRRQRTARSPLENRGPWAEPRAILVRGASLWTCGPAGRLENQDLLIVDGKIRNVGRALAVPNDLRENAVVIDARGKHVTPGLIDAHNHSMILGGVNEGSIPSSAMVRIGDVVNSETANLYRQLAGGLTVANLLHGSANPIGGQNAIIKLRDGASPEELKLAGAPPGIKFALGENVKQSNRSDDSVTRFPQTRMGVPTFMANRFTAARQYLQAQAKAGADDPPVRRDLELEAIGEILRGERWIHCHSYRQDEILAFLRLMEQFEVKVGTLQHILEGYKLADEIARHGAGASAFSDWWAYKLEVFDAIPYAGSLMRERGVLVSFNSDSSDHARRLNLEAAKAVKYGETPEVEALKFVTINPARQLRIDAQVGSLEPGKDGDFVLWSRSPLDSFTICEQTWIEGKKYFDRDQDQARVKARSEERQLLLEKAKKLTQTSGGAAGDKRAQAKFFSVCWEHQYDTVNRHCLDHE